MRMLNHVADLQGVMDVGGLQLYGHSCGGCLAPEIVIMHPLAEDSRIQQRSASVVRLRAGKRSGQRSSGQVLSNVLSSGLVELS
jgi:hypothetical protein